MPGYASDSLVRVYPYSHRVDGDSVVIGDPERNVFVAIPPAGLEILGSLAAGRTVGEAGRDYHQGSGEQVDVPDFLDALQTHGFVSPVEDDVATEGAVHRPRIASRGLTLRWLTPAISRRIVGAPFLIACGVIIVVGLALLVDDSGIMPTPRSLMFPIDFAALAWTTFLVAVFSVFLHEVGHVAAARAAGFPARIRISNRLYVLVAETDMTGIWLAPKRQRYLAFMIGSIIDAASASLVVAFLWFSRHGWIHPPRWTDLLASALLLAYGTRLVWQWFFFLRTDGYYVIATAFGCKNLLSDTEDFLRNTMRRLFRRTGRIDQSAVPAREMRVVRSYAVMWIVGRFIALGVYFGVGLPVLWGYLYQVLLYVSGQHSKFGTVDFATIVVLAYLTDVTGFVLWLRSLFRNALRRRRDRVVLARAGSLVGASQGLVPATAAALVTVDADAMAEEG